MIQTQKLVRSSGVPNFLGKRIPVISDLNISTRRRHLCDYFDQQLVDLIQFGFSLDFDRDLELLSTFKNNATAVESASHVVDYIEGELRHWHCWVPWIIPL